MGNLNRAIIVGNVGRMRELRSTPQGKQVIDFSLATNEHYTGADGSRRESTEWHNIVVWGKMAAACARYLQAGSPVCVEGRVQTRKYQVEGRDRFRTEIVARQVVFLGAKGKPDRAVDDGPLDG